MLPPSGGRCWLSGCPSCRRLLSVRRDIRWPHWATGVNAGWLLVLSVAILVGAAGRLLTGTGEVHGLPVLIVSGIAAVVMFVGALILGGDSDNSDSDNSDNSDSDNSDSDNSDSDNKAGGDLNMRAVLLDTAGDAAAAAGVAVAGAIIYMTKGLYWLDPVVAAIIAVVVGYHAVRLLIEIFEALHAHRRSASRP
ncbi:cation transporter [Arthrobacter gyeryongensis]|uniref:cation transporter n=1 Tax=Arthrobacter gyeryongensis TaxID=1650592 RepID=UPI0031F01DD6